jgi:hypothetical protein
MIGKIVAEATACSLAFASAPGADRGNMLREIIWKAAIHAAAWALILLGSLSLIAWGHRLGTALLSALLIGLGILIGTLARLSVRAAPPDHDRGRAGHPPARSHHSSG